MGKFHAQIRGQLADRPQQVMASEESLLLALPPFSHNMMGRRVDADGPDPDSARFEGSQEETSLIRIRVMNLRLL